MEFDSSSNYIFGLTFEGILSLWNFTTLQRTATLDLKTDSGCLAVSKKHPYCLVSAGPALYTVSLQDIESISYKFTLTEVTTLYLTDFYAMALSPNDKKLACIMCRQQYNTTDPSIVETIYSLRVYEMNYFGGRPEIGETLCDIEFSERPSLLDITVDSAYAMVCFESGEQIKIDCEQGTKMEEGAEIAMNWSGDGILLSPFVKPVLSLWGEDNKVTSIVKIAPDRLCVADQRGTLSLVEIHSNGDVKTWEQLYSNHLSNVNLLRVSDDKKWLLSYSTVDRSIIAWSINQRRKTIQSKILDIVSE